MFSNKLFIFSDCNKSLYVYINDLRMQSQLINLFEANNNCTINIRLKKCLTCCFRVNLVDEVTAEYILANNNVSERIMPYTDSTIESAFETLSDMSFIIASKLNVELTKENECCELTKFAFFKDLCTGVVYGVDDVYQQAIELNPSYIYNIGKVQDNIIYFRPCRYIVSADSYELIQLYSINIIHNIPIDKFPCDGLYRFEPCDGGDAILSYMVNGELGDKGTYYNINGKCYQYVGNESGFESATDDCVDISEQYTDCECTKGDLVFRMCSGDITFATSNYTADLSFIVGNYYSLGDYKWFNIDGRLYKNCCEFVGYSKYVDVTLDIGWQPFVNKANDCVVDDCRLYYETTLTSCVFDFEQTVYVNADVANYMADNEYSSFAWNGKTCLTLPYGNEPVDELKPNVPVIELEAITEFYKDCGECFDNSEYTCYVIHPCDGSRDIYITKSEGCVMSEDDDELSQFNGRYISFNFFGEIMCGYVEENCYMITNSSATENRTITKENIIECYFSCTECNDNEDAKAKQREEEPVIKLGREVEPNYEVNDEYCKQDYKNCCCDDIS